jgi:hypothetical protein
MPLEQTSSTRQVASAMIFIMALAVILTAIVEACR